MRESCSSRLGLGLSVLWPRSNNSGGSLRSSGSSSSYAAASAATVCSPATVVKAGVFLLLDSASAKSGQAFSSSARGPSGWQTIFAERIRCLCLYGLKRDLAEAPRTTGNWEKVIDSLWPNVFRDDFLKGRSFDLSAIDAAFF